MTKKKTATKKKKVLETVYRRADGAMVKRLVEVKKKNENSDGEKPTDEGNQSAGENK